MIFVTMLLCLAMSMSRNRLLLQHCFSARIGVCFVDFRPPAAMPPVVQVVRRDMGLPGLSRMTKSQLQDLAAALFPGLRTDNLTVPAIRAKIEELDIAQREDRSSSSAGGSQPVIDGTRGHTGAPDCKCGELATIFRVSNRDSANLGRLFWVCRKERDDLGRCNYFAWHDAIVCDLGVQTPAAAPRSSAVDRRPSTVDQRPSTVDHHPSTVDQPRSNVYDTVGTPDAKTAQTYVDTTSRDDRLSRAWGPRTLTVTTDDRPRTAVTVDEELEIIEALQRLVMATPRDIEMVALSLDRFGGSLSEADRQTAQSLLDTAYWHSHSAESSRF